MRGYLHQFGRIPVWLLTCVALFYVPASVAADVKTSMSSEVETVLPMGHAQAAIIAISVAPDGRSAMVGDAAGVIKIWDLRSGRELFSVERFDVVARNGIAHSRDGRHVVVVGNSGLIRIFDQRTGRLLGDARLTDPAHKVEAVAVAEGAKRLLIQTAGLHDVYLVDIAGANVNLRLLHRPAGFSAMAISRDGARAAFAGTDGIMRVVSLYDGRVTHHFPVDRFANALAFSPDGGRLLVGSATADLSAMFIAEFDVRSGLRGRTFHTGKGFPLSVAYSAGGQRVAAGLDNGSQYMVRVWDQVSGRHLGVWQDAAFELQFLPDGTLVSGSTDGRIAIRKVAPQGGRKTPADAERMLQSAVRMPLELLGEAKGHALTVAYSGRELVTWSLADGRLLRRQATKAELWTPELDGAGLEEGGGFLPALRRGSDGVPRLLYFSPRALPSRSVVGKVATPYAGRDAASKLFVASLLGPDGQGIWRVDREVTLPDLTDKRLADMLAGALADQLAAKKRAGIDVDFDLSKPIGLRPAFDAGVGLTVLGVNYGLPDWKLSTSGYHSASKLLVSGAVGRWHAVQLGNVGAIVDLRVLGKSALVLALPPVNVGRSNNGGVVNALVAQMIDLTSGKSLWSQKITPGYSALRDLQLAISPDQRMAVLILGVASGLSPLILNLADGAVRELPHRFTPSGGAAFSRDGRRVVWSIGNGRILVAGNVDAKPDTYIVQGHDDRVPSVMFSNDGKRLHSSSMDGTVRIWDVERGRELVRMVYFESGEWVTITPEGYFSGSPGGIDRIMFRRGVEHYALNQFYDVFYRPDLVRRKLAGEDLAPYITVTAAQALAAPPPEVVIHPIIAPPDAARVRLQYSIAGDSGIGAVRVYHNGKLVDSRGDQVLAYKTGVGTQLADVTPASIVEQLRGLNARKRQLPASMPASGEASRYSGEIELEPVPGENRFSITAYNGENSVQSRLVSVEFHSTRRAEPPRLFILASGINRYRDPAATLDFAVKDAQQFSTMLQQRAQQLFGSRRVEQPIVLIDAQATRSGIRAAYEQLMRRMQPQDVFVGYFSGHGVLEGGVYSVVTHDYAGGLRTENLLSAFDLGDLSKRLPAKRQLWVLDTCHAGGLNELFQGLYDARVTAFAHHAGLHVFASAQTLEEARDGYRGNGLFTHVLLQAMQTSASDVNRDGQVSAEELGNFSRDGMARLTRKIGATQSPVIARHGDDIPLYAVLNRSRGGKSKAWNAVP